MMSIDDIVSELKGYINLTNPHIGKSVTRRMLSLVEMLVSHIKALEGQSEMRREMIKAFNPTLGKEEVGYKPKMGKTFRE